MKAIIQVAKRGSAVRAAWQQLAAARRGKSPDYHSSFESARFLFAELTPARVDLLDTERTDEGTVSVPYDSVEVSVPLAQVV
jgi:hypothetical protein